MNKSEFLDELRLEVGLAFDYARDMDDFILRVLQGVYLFLARKVECCLTAYELSERGTLIVKNTIGKDRKSKEAQFGFGFINQSNIHTRVLLQLNNKQILLVPIHEGRVLKYVFKLEVNNYFHTYTKDDVDFINEVVRFIEVRQKSFCNDDKR